jgi:hypothetical protein
MILKVLHHSMLFLLFLYSLLVILEFYCKGETLIALVIKEVRNVKFGTNFLVCWI